MRELAALNERCGIRGGYQNHAGTNVGSAVWDLHLLLKEVGSSWLGCQYDIRHAVVEGSGSWPNALRLVAPFVHTVDVKDSHWEKTDKGWRAANVPLGEGAVDLVGLLPPPRRAGRLRPGLGALRVPVPRDGPGRAPEGGRRADAARPRAPAGGHGRGAGSHVTWTRRELLAGRGRNDCRRRVRAGRPRATPRPGRERRSHRPHRLELRARAARAPLRLQGRLHERDLAGRGPAREPSRGAAASASAPRASCGRTPPCSRAAPRAPATPSCTRSPRAPSPSPAKPAPSARRSSSWTRVLEPVHEYARAVTGRPDLRKTFTLNALVPRRQRGLAPPRRRERDLRLRRDGPGGVPPGPGEPPPARGRDPAHGLRGARSPRSAPPRIRASSS